MPRFSTLARFARFFTPWSYGLRVGFVLALLVSPAKSAEVNAKLAQTLFREGREALASGDDATACAKFAESVQRTERARRFMSKWWRWNWLFLDVPLGLGGACAQIVNFDEVFQDAGTNGAENDAGSDACTKTIDQWNRHGCTGRECHLRIEIVDSRQRRRSSGNFVHGLW